MAAPQKCRVYYVDDNGAPVPEMFTTNLSGQSPPSRALICSVLIHGVFLAATLYVPWSSWLHSDAKLVTAQSVIRGHQVLLLPDLTLDSKSGMAAPGSDGISRKDDAASADGTRSKESHGMVYKGPQFIVSNPPHPDNVIQTIRQPDLVKPPKLPAPLPLPPMVAIAPSRPVLAPQPTRPAAPVDPAPHQDAEQVAVSKPIIVPSPQAPVEAPKLPLPAASSANALLHAVTDASNPAAIPKLAARRPIPGKPNNEVRNLLVVDAIPFPERKLAAMPSGELSGAFAVSPIPTDVHPGAMAAPAAAGRAELKDGVGHGHGNASVGMGGAHGAGTGDGRGLSSAGGKAATAGGTGDSGVGHGSGRTGTGRGKDTGDLGAGLRGSSKGTDNGSGAGAGAGNSPFSGITIQGGKGSSGFGIIGAPKVSAVKPQTSYGMTIISSGSSGGGFKDFGVFRNEAAYTVYLNMADAGINGPNWTLQYALYSVPDSSSVSRGLLAPPFAISKALPQFPLEIAKRNHGSLVVVYGVINASGKFEDLRVMQSPDVALNPSLLEALEKWMFQPAEVDGSHVAVKVLLGVPVGLFSGV